MLVYEKLNEMTLEVPPNVGMISLKDVLLDIIEECGYRYRVSLFNRNENQAAYADHDHKLVFIKPGFPPSTHLEFLAHEVAHVVHRSAVEPVISVEDFKMNVKLEGIHEMAACYVSYFLTGAAGIDCSMMWEFICYHEVENNPTTWSIAMRTIDRILEYYRVRMYGPSLF